MKPKNFPERKRWRQLSSLHRLKTHWALTCKPNHPERVRVEKEIAVLEKRTATNLRKIRTKKDRRVIRTRKEVRI